MQKLSITNTAANPTLGDALNIEASEKIGQAELVNSSQLPVNVRGDKSILVDAGVVFGETCPDDNLFCQATLPAGWEVKATDHSMWSNLIDADGNIRASIFYKAAFYDRDAFMNVEVP